MSIETKACAAEQDVVETLFERHVGYSEFSDAIKQGIANILRIRLRDPETAIKKLLSNIDLFRGGGD